MEGKAFDDFKVSRSAKVSEVSEQIKSLPAISDHGSLLIKMFAGGQVLQVPQNDTDPSLAELGVENNLLVLCTDPQTVNRIDTDVQLGISDRTRTLEEEDALEASRRSGSPATKSKPKTGEIQDWGFSRIEPLQIDPMTAAPYEDPSPEDARRLLEQLAQDRGIQGIMRSHHWRVGLLTEIPPTADTGLVGLSDHCLLGLNKNRGEVTAAAAAAAAASAPRRLR